MSRVCLLMLLILPGAAWSGGGTLRVGSVDLRPCPAVSAYCGNLDRALDPAGFVAGTLSIHFEFHPHTGKGASVGMLVATEGGPGYPATGSRDDYLWLFAPLRKDHDVLFMDNRGTGSSGAIDCPDLQTAERWTVALISACGDALGDRAPFYGTAFAADDLAAILRALDAPKIDLYGDSYGTYFEQVFATRHPEMLRTIVLDGAYPLSGPDYAWYPTYAPAMRDKFDLACARSAPCAALPGTSIDHIEPALQQLRTAPVAASGYDTAGTLRRFTADASQLAIVMFANAPPLTTVREVDAAARAFDAGDRPPLLRLMAETAAAVDSRDPTADPTQWSAGLAAAVMCDDPPQIFDMRLPPALRSLDRDRALAERRRSFPETYAPFSIDEFRGMPLDYSFLDECVGWPVAPASHAAGNVGRNAVYPDVPALVISGELDDITTMTDGAAVAAAFHHGVQVRVANSFHVNALPRARSSCAAVIARRFILTRTVGDIACAARVPPVRLVPRFAMKASELESAAPLPGNGATRGQLKIVSAAVLAVGDVLARIEGNSAESGVGLRGGAFSVRRTAGAVHLRLNDFRWVEDSAISGSIERPAGRDGLVRANLRVTPVGGSAATADSGGRLRLEWREGAARPTVLIRGTLGAANVAARSPAP